MAGTAIYKVFQSILTQFFDDTTFITIIDNESLNHELQKLAKLLAPAIIRANQSVKQAVLPAYARQNCYRIACLDESHSDF